MEEREDLESSQSPVPSCPHPAMPKPYPAPEGCAGAHTWLCQIVLPRRTEAVDEDSAPRGADSPRFSDWSVRGEQLRGGEGGREIEARCAAA